VEYLRSAAVPHFSFIARPKRAFDSLIFPVIPEDFDKSNLNNLLLLKRTFWLVPNNKKSKWEPLKNSLCRAEKRYRLLMEQM
jgi:hypothetical protein